jgi:hypothetical protein
VRLDEVFGIATEVSAASYVNRGGLDERLEYLLRTQRHIAIHGDSKQGKSWLRSRLLGAEETIVVQCQIDTTPESLFREALGALDVRAELKRVGATQFEGQLDFTGGGELGNRLLGKVSVDASATGKAGKETETETEPIGKTPGDLSWVARTLAASERRLVIEDFHYVTEENRRAFSFILKALGDYGVHLIIVGVWPEDHLLTYYNGDLDGRVEDVRLRWSSDELEQVLRRGADALNVEFAEDLIAAMVNDAYGNVGLLQRLAEQLCIAEGVTETADELQVIGTGETLEAARRNVSDSMRARFQAFADDFVRGMKRMTEGLEVYKHLLRAFSAADSGELLEGIDSRDAPAVRQSDLTQALDRVDRLQAKIGVRPLVLTYDRDRRRLFLADRSFLFFRKYGNPSWPWDEDQTLEEALARAPELQPLDVEAEFPVSVGDV